KHGLSVSERGSESRSNRRLKRKSGTHTAWNATDFFGLTEKAETEWAHTLNIAMRTRPVRCATYTKGESWPRVSPRDGHYRFEQRQRSLNESLDLHDVHHVGGVCRRHG